MESEGAQYEDQRDIRAKGKATDPRVKARVLNEHEGEIFRVFAHPLG